MKCHSYIFFDTEMSIHALPAKRLAVYKTQFTKLVAKKKSLRTTSYATLGFKAGSRFMIHVQAEDTLAIQELARDLMHTDLGKHLKITYTLFGMTRTSQYSHATKEAAEPKDTPHTYLIVYPFTKTIEWHLLPFEERRKIMGAHVMVGRKFIAAISQRLLYSFGVDDHEFIVSYMTDSLSDFQTLVMELRGTEGRRYTACDTPIFLCTHMPLTEALDML